MGACAFDAETLSYAGTPVEQAMCLMRGMDATRNLAPPLTSLPSALASRIGETTGLPTREVLSNYLSKENLETDFAAHLWEPLSRAHDNDPDSPTARYFVIHDTSGPNYGHRAFPDDINTDAHYENLADYACTDGWGRAHVFINRIGEMLLAHDYSIPWRETKFEQAAEFGGALQGLFLHNELVQPRKSAPATAGATMRKRPIPPSPRRNTTGWRSSTPLPAVRKGKWLVPAFHAAIDADIPNGHDDPLHFDIDSFAASLDGLAEKLGQPVVVQAAH